MNDFNTPTRQSAKGILVIFGISVYKLIKQAIVVVSLFLLKYLSSDKDSFVLSSKFLLITILFIAFLFLLAILKYRSFKFYLSESNFILNKGIINKEEISIPKYKIQNVLIKQNLIQQIIDVVSVAIETAGDDSTEIEIKALSKEDANHLKQLLLSDRSQVETETTKTKTDTNIYFKVSIRKLLLEGITENHFKSFMLILFFIVGLYNDVKEFVKSFGLWEKLDGYFQLSESGIIGFVLFNLSLVLILLAFAFLVSLVKTVIENFNLRVLQGSKGLEINKGLFNKVSVALMASRIQNTTLKTNRLKQTLGLYQLSFTQAMLNKKQGKNFKIIGLGKEKANDLVLKFYPELFKDTNKLKPNRYFVFKEGIAYGLLIGLCNLIFAFATPKAFLLNIPIVVLSAMAMYYGYKKAYFIISDRYLTIGSGRFIETKTDFLELHKIQAVSLSQTLFQKRRGLASVKVFSASKALEIPHIKLTLANTINNYLLYKVESSDKSWM